MKNLEYIRDIASRKTDQNKRDCDDTVITVRNYKWLIARVDELASCVRNCTSKKHKTENEAALAELEK